MNECNGAVILTKGQLFVLMEKMKIERELH